MKIYRTFFRIILTLFLGLTLSSCFDFIEDITLQDNGSGHIKATLNLSKSKVKVASLMSLESVAGYKVPSKAQIQEETTQIVSLLNKTPGISNVDYTLDLDNFIATLSCDFENIQALNVFSKALGDKFNSTLALGDSYDYNIKEKVFKRNYEHDPSFTKALDKFDTEDTGALQEAYYTQIIRFQSQVVSTSNVKSKVSSNKKSVMLREKMVDLVKGSSNLANTIKL